MIYNGSIEFSMHPLLPRRKALFRSKFRSRPKREPRAIWELLGLLQAPENLLQSKRNQREERLLSADFKPPSEVTDEVAGLDFDERGSLTVPHQELPFRNLVRGTKFHSGAVSRTQQKSEPFHPGIRFNQSFGTTDPSTKFPTPIQRQTRDQLHANHFSFRQRQQSHHWAEPSKDQLAEKSEVRKRPELPNE